MNAKLAEAQARHEELLERIADPDFYRDQEAFSAAMAEYAALKSRLPQLEEEWLELTSQIEELEAES